MPALPRPYLGVAAVLDEDLMLTTHDGAITTKGVLIPVTTSKTIEVDVFSDGPTADWTVEAIGVASACAVARRADVRVGQDQRPQRRHADADDHARDRRPPRQ